MGSSHSFYNYNQKLTYDEIETLRINNSPTCCHIQVYTNYYDKNGNINDVIIPYMIQYRHELDCCNYRTNNISPRKYL